MKRIDLRTPDAWRSYDLWKFLITLVVPVGMIVAWYQGLMPPMSACCGSGEVAKTAAVVAPVAKAPAAPVALVAPDVAITSAGGKVTLKGKVGDEATRKALVAEAARAFGADNVVDKLEVVADRGPVRWLKSAKDVLADLRDMPAPADIVSGASVVTLSGTVETDAEKDLRGRRARELFGEGVTIANGIKVKAPAPVAVVAEPTLTPVVGADGRSKYTLPGGAVIEVEKDGLEAKLLGFITNKNQAIDPKLWFDFDRLSFQTASSNLTPESKGQISAAVAILKAYPAVAVKIGGYTDNQGDAGNNLTLSDARAKRVMDELVASGIAADRLEAKGYGEEHPIGDNATAEGRAKNRRTSLSVRSK